MDLLKKWFFPSFLILVSPALLSSQNPATPAPTASGYKILKSVSLPGDGTGDYLICDSDSRRVYVTHDKIVQVLDADTFQKVGTIEGLQTCHGVALAPELGKGFITSGKDGMIVVFDLKTLKVMGRVAAQNDADSIIYDPGTQRVFSFNGDSGNSTILDAAGGKVVGTINLDGKPEFAAVDGQGYLFNNLEDKNEVLKINTKTLQIEERWPLANGKSPSSMAMDRANRRLFIGCRDKTALVLNADNGNVVQSLPIGEHVDATCFDPGSQTAFFSCADGTLSVIHEDSPNKYSLVETAATEPAAKTMAFDPKTAHIFLSTAKFEPAPTPTKDNPKPKRKAVQGTFHVLVLGK